MQHILDEIATKANRKINEADQQVIRRLVDIAGVSKTIVNTQDIMQIREAMMNRGYTIQTHTPTRNITYHNLYCNGAPVLTGKVEWSIVEQDGHFTLTVTSGFESNPISEV